MTYLVFELSGLFAEPPPQLINNTYKYHPSHFSHAIPALFDNSSTVLYIVKKDSYLIWLNGTINNPSSYQIMPLLYKILV